MSKMDNLRALREARYEQDKAARTAPSTGTAPAARKAAPRRATAAPSRGSAPSGTAGTPPAESACGHRAISGRTCTRPAGHAEKNHRYA
ncbi:hypothetical protein [Nocardioides deserti]|uniref:Uncharacterized protein n=1 Tax=Nocardioides deserti TaxID=1588644 RepID=A0ABR6UBB5_9ACTN|nr:hypothetical protein [Nocardioides deserti]MBC2961740.1 hypothetical protein [Nocardioides deserti]GGO73118.1 hypothetical protein GCM10012276_17940 [Nocardioides deserti]